MLLAYIPAKIPEPFANLAGPGFINVIPDTTTSPGAASWRIGFPPQTFLDEASGGTPPAGADWNGVLEAISAWAQWAGFGNPVPWDASLGAAGYPRGAFLVSADGLHNWLNTVDGNTTNPDAAGAGWASVGPFGNIMSLNAGSGLYISAGLLNAVPSGQRATLNTNLTVPPGDYLVDTSLGPVTITTQAPGVYGQAYSFEDAAGTWGQHDFTLIGGGGVLIGNRWRQVASVVAGADDIDCIVWNNGTFLELK